MTHASPYTRSLFEASLDPLVAIGLEGKITDVNEATVKFTGVQRETLIGTDFCKYFTDPDKADAGYREALSKGSVTDYPLTIRHQGGRLTDVLYNATVYRDLQGKTLGSFAAAREVNRMKSEFLANMSHELRTPLNAIMGFATLMAHGTAGQVSARQQEFLGDILESSNHLLQLINDVIDLAKVDAGKMEFHPEPVDLPQLVGDVRDILRTVATRKKIRIDTDFDPMCTGLVLDPAKLKQVLHNYLSNALEVTPENGCVSIRIRPSAADSFRVEVEDTGIGIRPEDVNGIFTEVLRLDSSAPKQHQRTGLGLALTKRIVEGQGGRVGVDSLPGRGSTFFVVLPRRPLTLAPAGGV